MDIGDLLAPKGVVLRSGASSKRQALHALAEAASHALGLDEARIFDALMERETLGSTGLGAGVAVPHARLTEVEKVTAVFVRLDTPVAYDAVDD
ncbi:MAG: PTS sugar transporter subunit IIA, partial [Pseudomonadota bacterium]|nr:PTS sugar transporter subunit IIA [Pseudomonadota bacterium]